MLLGDSADNIGGIPGYGPIKVYNLLRDCKNEKQLLDRVREAYYTQGKSKLETIDDVCEAADLLWIRQKREEFKSDEIRGMLNEI
jgi:5'-3' exonuclease